MSTAPATAKSVYQFPRYYAIGYRWNTEAECDFLEACVSAHRSRKASTMLDIGCGAGRHLLGMAKRGYTVSGFDVRPEMVAYVQQQAKDAQLPVDARVADIRDMNLSGRHDLAVCLMDTFRYLLTNDDIIRHFREIAEHLTPGGLYVTDFWIPAKWDQTANEIYQWEQTEGRTTVKVFYLQHPETIDPVAQTFEDELVFVVDDRGEHHEIRGERTRTRLILPQEFRALVDASGAFDVADTFAEFDRDKRMSPACMSWRMISVLKKRD